RAPTRDSAVSAHRLNVAAGRSRRRNHAAVDVAHALHPTQRHGHIELPGEDVDRRGDARLAAGAEAVGVGASDHAGARPLRGRARTGSWRGGMPRSNSPSTRPPPASTTWGSAEIEEGAPSSWRPP